MPPGNDLYTLVSVNKNPERAKRIITRVVEDVKDTYNIQYVANCSTIAAVPQILADTKPDILVGSSPCRGSWPRSPFNLRLVSPFPQPYHRDSYSWYHDLVLCIHMDIHREQGNRGDCKEDGA